MNKLELIKKINKLFSEALIIEKNPIIKIKISKTKFISFMNILKTNKDLSFDMLYDHTAIDWIYKNEFELIYNLYSTTYGYHIIVSVNISRSDPRIITVSNIWSISEWQERETYDLFGILYEDHKDLRRLFLNDDWNGYPLRKDYKDNFMLER